MSGIFGIFHLGAKRGEAVAKAHLEPMREALAHRGPDGARLLMDGDMGMGHLAMHVTPESVREELPYRSPGSHLVITADARIDNREELFERLSILHPERKNIPDSLLVLKAFEKWGNKSPSYLLGEFAFAIWDNRSRSLFCARDHLGVRPFFYYCSPTHFIFASEIKGIRALRLVPPQVVENVLARMLLPVDRDFGQTLFKGMMRLRPAHWLLLRNGQPRTRRYWTPEPVKKIRYATDNAYAEELRELLLASVHSRLRTLPGVQVGIALSGGLDSSSLACIAARKLAEQNRRLVAVSSVMTKNHKGIESDEREYIRAVLEQEPNIDIQYVTAKGRGPFDNLETAFNQVEHLIKPFHYIDRALWEAALDRGVRLILFGEGGDHMASYPGNNSLFRLVRAGKWAKAFRLAQQLSRVEGKPLARILKSHIVKPLLPSWLAYYYHRFKRGKKITGTPFNNPVNPDFAAASGFTAARAHRQWHTVPNYPAVIVDKLKHRKFAIEEFSIRMTHFQLDGVFPFYDKRIVEFCLGVPPEQFIAGGWKRSLIRRAMEGILPPVIQWRRDKHVYSPDFHRRLITVKPEMIRFLDAVQQNDPVLQYIDIDCIKTHFERLRPAKGRADWDGHTPGIVANGIIFIKFFQWLTEQKW